MASDTIDNVEWVKTSIPGMEIARLSASDGQTYTSRKFQVVEAASLTMNEDSDSAHPNVENADDTEIDGTSAQVKLNLNGITTKTVTLVLFGGSDIQT